MSNWTGLPDNLYRLQEYVKVGTGGSHQWDYHQLASGAAVVVDHEEETVALIRATGDDHVTPLDTAEFITLSRSSMRGLLLCAKAVLAIKARIDGEFDNKCLMTFGALSPSRIDDVLWIANTAAGGITEGVNNDLQS